MDTRKTAPNGACAPFCRGEKDELTVSCVVGSAETNVAETLSDELRTKGSKWVFPQYELFIEHEPDDSEAVDA